MTEEDKKSPLKEITVNANKIKSLHTNSNNKEINPAQGSLGLSVNCEKEIQGVGMGVLSDGTPYLTQRGLAGLCGVENAHIGTISSQWQETDEKPRIKTIKELLASRGLYISLPHIEVSHNGRKYFAYPASVCLAVLEYYAFEAGSNTKETAKNNFRLLAGRELEDFIYTQVGYDPNNTIPDEWKQFHDRMSLTYNSVPKGFFSVFKETADIIVMLGQNGLMIDSSFVPDISIGVSWGKYWTDNNFERTYGARKKWEHNYPEYFPQSLSNPQQSWCYPEMALGEFRHWLRENYIGLGKFENYLKGQVKKKVLPPSFVQIAVTAYKKEDT